jgi:hypothetical protein
MIEFIELLQNVTTSNYNRFTMSHTLQFTLARAKSSTSSLGVATQRLPTIGTLREGATVSHQPQIRICLSRPELTD